jgi:hypothetical protein
MKNNDSYYEIGRGLKLIPMEYWHQYVLGIDLIENRDYFVVSEVGKDKVLFKKNLSLDNLVKDEWSELLEISETKDFINQMKNDYVDEINLKIEIESLAKTIEKCKKILNGQWISINEYSGLDYNSNFGNWVDASPIKGRLKFHLDLNNSDDKKCRIEIPVNYWTMGNGYYSIISGRFQMSLNQILIWEDDIFPHQIKYEINDSRIILRLYENDIEFERK